MNKYQYQKKMAAYLLLASGATFLSNNVFAKAALPTPHLAVTIERLAASSKHKILTEKAQSIEREAAEIAADTQKAILALDKKDTKEAVTILQGVSTKLDTLPTKNSEMGLVPADVEADVYDFDGTNQQVSNVIDEAETLLRHGKLQAARQIIAGMASEVRVTTTSIPLGSYPAAIKRIIPLIDSGNIDQAIVDLSNVLSSLVITTEVIPLPVFRAEELLSAAAEMEHRDDLSKEVSREEIQKYTDAAKDKLELAQLLGYGEKSDYKMLYKEIDAIHKTLFSEHSAAIWQKIKDDLAQFKDRLKGLEAAAERIGHPVK